MCIHCDPGVDCAHDRAEDVWVTPVDLRRPAPASTSGPLAPDQHENVHAPTLTRGGFSERLRALGRDGGEPNVYEPRWCSAIPPGGFVCNLCGTPVESEPCPEHGADR